MIEILFGTATAVSFAGMERTRKNYIAVGCLTTVLFFLQVICLNAWDIDVTFKLYPLLSHLPITVFIVAYLKRPWLISLTSVLASFLCCQPPRWIGTALGEVFDSVSINHVSYIAAAFLTYCFLRKYAVDISSASDRTFCQFLPAFWRHAGFLLSVRICWIPSLSRHKKNLNHYGRCKKLPHPTGTICVIILLFFRVWHPKETWKISKNICRPCSLTWTPLLLYVFVKTKL